ncbi:MAG TPA: hypothetical protein VF435_01430, partial [Pyrinomonadaceae bacterium]
MRLFHPPAGGLSQSARDFLTAKWFVSALVGRLEGFASINPNCYPDGRRIRDVNRSCDYRISAIWSSSRCFQAKEMASTSLLFMVHLSVNHWLTLVLAFYSKTGGAVK